MVRKRKSDVITEQSGIRQESPTGETTSQKAQTFVYEHQPTSLDRKLILTTLMYTSFLFIILFGIIGMTRSTRGYNFPMKFYMGMQVALYQSGMFGYRYLAPTFNTILEAITGHGWPIGEKPTVSEAFLYGSIIMFAAFVVCFLIRIKLVIEENKKLLEHRN